METQIIVNKDEHAATMYVMKIYSATVEEVWNYFTKAELLDQWWAPKPWKCETVKMDFRSQGAWKYSMIGPENEKVFGGINYNEVNPQRSFDGTDYFADENGEVNTELPTTNLLIGFTGIEQGTKVTVNIHFKTREDMSKILEMGMEEGFKTGLNQLEELLKNKD